MIVGVCIGDVVGNGTVGASDLAELLSAWGTSDIDLDGDGVTGAADLAAMLGNWGLCN